MSIVSPSSALVDRDEHDDSRCYQGKEDVEGYLFAACKHRVAKDAPQKCDTCGLTVCNLSACHGVHLFSWMKQAIYLLYLTFLKVMIPANKVTIKG